MFPLAASARVASRALAPKGRDCGPVAGAGDADEAFADDGGIGCTAEVRQEDIAWALFGSSAWTVTGIGHHNLNYADFRNVRGL